MTATEQIIVLNPGSTSTKIAVFDGLTKRFSVNIDHPAAELEAFADIVDQLPFRRQAIIEALKEASVDLDATAAFAAICTGLPAMPGGVYEVEEQMAEAARVGAGSRHPGRLGPLLAYDFAKLCHVKGFVVDPSSVDEFCDEARLTGFRGLLRISRGHPLNQRAVALRYAAENGLNYEEINLVVAHMGGGISVSAHQHGKMIDTVDSTCGEGRMAPTRTGMLPAARVVDLCFSGEYSKKDLLDRIQKCGGWTDLLGTADAREVLRRIDAGDEWARLVFNTTAYQIAKDIGSCAATMSGDVQAILLTGGLCYAQPFVEKITSMVKFIAPVHVYPGEFEMEALAQGALSVLQGKVKARIYTGEPVFKGFPESKAN